MKTKKNKLFKLFKIGTFLFVFSLLLWNCEKQDDYLELEQNSEYINNSRDYFNSLSLTEHQKELISTSKDIDWNNHKIFKDNNSTIIEVFLTPKNSTLLKTDNNSIINFHNRIVFVFEAEKSVEYYFTTVLSSSNQLKFISNKENINYSKVSDKFSGTIFIENKEGESFVNKYINGMLQNKPSNNLYAKVTGDCYIVVESFSDGSTRNVPGSRFCFWTTNENTYRGGYNGGGGSNGNNNNNSADDKIDTSELTGKAKCVYEKLEKLSTDFKNMIKKFDGDFPVSHLNLIMEDLGNTRGETRAPNGAGSSPDYVITIAINSNSNIHGVGYRPNLMTAKTIAHEVIHAEMFRKLLSVLDNGGNIAGVTRQNVLDALDGDFPGMYDYYRRHKNWQHQQMATHYRGTIADVLKKFDNNQHSNQFYMDLAWEGLKYSNISTWSSQSQQEKNRVNKVISDYINANKNQPCQ